MKIDKVKLEIYGPSECMEDLRCKLSAIGACQVGNYTHVSSFHKVNGSWMPVDKAKPYQGEINILAYGEEIKIEVRCPYEKVNEAITIIKKVHPYEEPLINIIPLLNSEFQIN